MNKMIRFFELSVMLILMGCGPDPSSQIEQDAGEIVQQAIFAEMNQQIESSPGNQSFLLNPGQLLLVHPGVNQAVNEDGRGMESFYPMEMITIARRYSAAKLTYTTLGVQSSQIREKDDSEYPYQAMLTISVNVNHEEYQNFDGFPLHAVIPEEWKTWSQQKKGEFLEELYSSLPPLEFDYRVIAESSAPKSEIVRNNWKRKIVWNQSRKHWELDLARGKGKERGKLKAAFPTWKGKEESESAIRQYLDSRGFVAYNGKNCRKTDLEIVKKLQQGLILSDGKWRDSRIVRAEHKLKMALEQWNKNRNFSDLEVMLKALSNLSESETFSACSQLAANGILTSVKAGDKKFWDELDFRMKTYAGETAILSEKVRNFIAATQRDITRIKTEIMQKILDVMSKLQEELKTCAPERLSQNRKTNFSTLSRYAETVQEVKTYLALIGILRNDTTLIAANADVSDPVLEDLYQNCPRCDGKGKEVCKKCHGSGICQECHGRGWKQIQTLDGFQQVSCPVRCPFCPKNPICPRCQGSGKIVLQAKLQNRLSTFYTGLMKTLDENISNGRALIAQMQQMMDQ